MRWRVLAHKCRPGRAERGAEAASEGSCGYWNPPPRSSGSSIGSESEASMAYVTWTASPTSFAVTAV
ncbi:hypothetical protein C5C06_13125 [Rathayibacter tritici]|nr:hypothetical protein C5C06_13125 [Rathayibacter tritici]PPF62963.1 hypothetical protein C5C21_13685 [Rathayibacter tritici]